jgi:hypothetical protein
MIKWKTIVAHLKGSHSMHTRNGPTYKNKQGALNGRTSHNEEH